MPRISYYNGEYNENIDVCRTHRLTQSDANRMYGHLADADGVCIADEHPDYEGEDYACDTCGKTLTGRDN